MILRLLLEEPESSHAYYQALQASYVFLKAYYRGQVTRTTLERLQERYTYSRGNRTTEDQLNLEQWDYIFNEPYPVLDFLGPRWTTEYHWTPPAKIRGHLLF
ncbi:hypothetical protein TWF694_003077 [Orbilia ellipsospora]|uniref:Uncharacterized protein n=1 Tax=Orbilia ellipsospora TaxID=2528407 RepID=A0AAV9X0J4_9PEZI